MNCRLIFGVKNSMNMGKSVFYTAIFIVANSCNNLVDNVTGAGTSFFMHQS